MKTKERQVTCCFYLLLFFFLFLSFFRIGSAKIPETIWISNEKGTEIFLDLGQETEVADIAYYLGNYDNRHVSLSMKSEDSEVWQEAGQIHMVQVYQWESSPVNQRGRYLKLTAENVFTQIRELVILNRAGERILPVNIGEYPELFDEADCFSGHASFQTGTIFDEPLYARTAYEYLNHLRSYEDTHPPLGKLLISVGIFFFGMNPFGWRFMGVISAAGILVLVWLIGGKLFKNLWTAFGVTLLLASDFLLFTLGRLAQIDTFLLLFTLAMYYFMFHYGRLLLAEADGTQHVPVKKTMLPLLCSGVCFGCAVSCKWSGFYPAAGLALIWLGFTVTGYRRGALNGSDLRTVIGWCVCSFLLVPAAIYCFSYLPYQVSDPDMGFFEKVLVNQKNMFQYHSQFRGSHTQSSRWFQWPLAARPITLFRGGTSDRLEQVWLLGNPVLWLSGLAAVFCSFYRLMTQKDQILSCLLIMYLSPLLPWIFISRSSFLYHYFPCIPPMVMIGGYCLEQHGKKGMLVLGVLTIASLCTFIWFYPILSGLPVTRAYMEGLEWLPWWNFV